MRISAVQFAAVTDVAANLDAIRSLVRQAARNHPRLVVLPEASMHDFGPADLPLGPVAQPLDGPFVAALQGLATEAETTLVAGMFEVSDDPLRPFNTVVVIGPEGQLSGSYRKVHLYDSFGYRESDRLRSGDPTSTVVLVDELQVGVMTCYDLRFPEMSRVLVDDGADVIVVPTAWVRGPLKEDHWVTLLRARAIENTVYVVGAAQTGLTYAGCSMIVDPMGVVLSSLGDEPGVCTGDAEVARLSTVRERNPSLANRRLRSVP